MGFIWIFPLILVSIVGVFAGLWLWTVFLETAKPQAVRQMLHAMHIVLNFVELWLWY